MSKRDQSLRATNKEFATLCKFLRENEPWENTILDDVVKLVFEQMHRQFAKSTIKDALEFEGLDYKKAPVRPGSAPDMTMRIQAVDQKLDQNLAELREQNENHLRRIKWLEYTINNMAERFDFDLQNQKV